MVDAAVRTGSARAEEEEEATGKSLLLPPPSARSGYTRFLARITLSPDRITLSSLSASAPHRSRLFLSHCDPSPDCGCLLAAEASGSWSAREERGPSSEPSTLLPPRPLKLSCSLPSVNTSPPPPGLLPVLPCASFSRSACLRAETAGSADAELLEGSGKGPGTCFGGGPKPLGSCAVGPLGLEWSCLTEGR
eukprot:2909420-Rhodomonas_salina.1